MAKDELRIFTPIGMLGYGFSEAIFWSTMAEGVDAVILDAGSTDSGPSKLALGKSTGTRKAYEQDLRTLVAGCHVYRKPLLIGRSLFTVGVSFLFFSFLSFFFFSFRGYKKVISMLGGNLDSDRSNLVIDSRQARYIFLFS